MSDDIDDTQNLLQRIAELEAELSELREWLEKERKMHADFVQEARLKREALEAAISELRELSDAWKEGSFIAIREVNRLEAERDRLLSAATKAKVGLVSKLDHAWLDADHCFVCAALWAIAEALTKPVPTEEP